MSYILINEDDLPREGGIDVKWIRNKKHKRIPSEHGRLIDADECGNVLLDKYTEGLNKWDELYRAGYRYALKYFSQAPTVLEASNGSDN